jgi:hypothetical protein
MIAKELKSNGLKLPNLYIPMVSLHGLSSDYNSTRAIIKSTKGINMARAHKMLHNCEEFLITCADTTKNVNYVAQVDQGKGQQ